MKSGIQLITEERESQLARYDTQHDDCEKNNELAVAAACYAADTTYAAVQTHSGNDAWPWAMSYPDKRGQLDRIRQLTISGALIAAEIDRLQRKEAKS